ncbi:MAG TPA: regulatory protein RecX [Rhodanobacteraceae bacterium]|nr:regulatory protein RecX [Rhodanobacteraceae bacterium]
MSRGKRKAAEAPRRAAYDKALAMLARREHSRRELGTRLQQAGYDEEESSLALARLGEQDYQDDRRFGEMLVRSRASQGYGPARIRAELKTHGIVDAVAGELINDVDVDWPASAAAQLRKRYGDRGAADIKERARRAQFLLRRGFDAATVRSLTRADTGDAGDAAD